MQAGLVPQANNQASTNLRFRLLLLDHDDTSVRGTEAVHYPAHVASVQELRPDLQPCSLEEWFEKNHHPGVLTYLQSLFTPDQMKEEHAIWRSYQGRILPKFYEGIPELLKEFKARGGKIAVVSHSPAEEILRQYKAHPMMEDIFPDQVYGWDASPERRKPNVWPAMQAMQTLGVEPAETLVLDDLLPGVTMGRSAGVTVAAAGWGHAVPAIQACMQRSCDFYFSTVNEFAEFLLGQPKSGKTTQLASAL